MTAGFHSTYSDMDFEEQSENDKHAVDEISTFHEDNAEDFM